MSRPTKGGKPYDRTALADYLDRLRREHNESFREAALRSGLDHGAFLRYVKHQNRPTRESCIALRSTASLRWPTISASTPTRS
jgi:hypothetical protein